MTFSQQFVQDKLEAIKGYREELRELLDKKDDSEIRGDSGSFHIAERLVQLIVDGMLDINQHIIRERELKISDDLRGTFVILGDNNVLPRDFAEKIAPLAGVRNILVHQYEKLDKELFLQNLRANFVDFENYQKYIMQYLER